MNRRNTISRELLSTIATVLVLGLAFMCVIQTALSAAYFIGERKSSLTDVLNNIDGEEILIRLADPSRAGIIYPAQQQENEQVLMLLMPMMLAE